MSTRKEVTEIRISSDWVRISVPVRSRGSLPRLNLFKRNPDPYRKLEQYRGSVGDVTEPVYFGVSGRVSVPRSRERFLHLLSSYSLPYVYIVFTNN